MRGGQGEQTFLSLEATSTPTSSGVSREAKRDLRALFWAHREHSEKK